MHVDHHPPIHDFPEHRDELQRLRRQFAQFAQFARQADDYETLRTF